MMNFRRLIFRNLWFHRKPYLAVLAGVMVTTTVLTGALIVGDSVKFSLARLTEMRLGNIRYAMHTQDRFFRQELATNLAADKHQVVAPALLAGGIAINPDRNERINQVNIIGIDNRFAANWTPSYAVPGPDSVIISTNVAERLQLSPGDEFLIRVQNKGKAPANAPFVSDQEPAISIRVKVALIADDRVMGRFSLQNNQTPPYNIFIPINQLAALLDMRGLANLLAVSDNGNNEDQKPLTDSAIQRCWQPADAGIIFREKPGRPTEITTDRIFFDDSTAEAIQQINPGCQSILTYLVNSISNNTYATPYSFITAGNEAFLKQPLAHDEIIVNEWLAQDLEAKPGDSVMIRYFLMGPLRSLREDSIRLVIKSVIPMDHPLSDPGLMPDFPGMSAAGNCRDWETSAPIDLKKIRDKDEDYWKKYRGTPKAFIAIETGQRIWGNIFGEYTAFRLSGSGKEIQDAKKKLMQHLKPSANGLMFKPVFQEGIAAAQNSTDFGELFLSLSFFILFSALLLTGMLFSFMTRMRLPETGILASIGFKKKRVMLIFASEALVVAFTGVFAGTLVAMIYDFLLIRGLNTVWQEAVNTSLLVVKINPLTLIAGALLAVTISLAAMLAVLWKNLRKPLAGIVKGDFGAWSGKFRRKNKVASSIIAAVSFGGFITLLLAPVISGKAASGEVLMMAGSLLIPGGLALLSLMLKREAKEKTLKIPQINVLIRQSLSRHAGRTITTVALLALGTFSVIITGANRKGAMQDETSRRSGTGGFLLWAETTLPVMHDLNSANGAAVYGLKDESALKNCRYVQICRKEGDDASCLNLNQVSAPALLGVPAETLSQLNAFSFLNLDTTIDQVHPWSALLKPLSSDMIPGFADQTVITWGLRKSVGDTLFYKDEAGHTLKIKLVGGLDNSLFQGAIMVSDSLLRTFYPSLGGTRILLVDGPLNQRDQIAATLESRFRDFGMMATPASSRLASFNAVENTYLSVFVILGGLGVIIGTIGLGIVLLRNISQRRQELSLYLALGLGRKFIMRLLIAEHVVLLIAGLILGLAAAMPVILPLVARPGNMVPWVAISGILLAIFVNGLLWIYLPTRKITQADPVSGLRSE